MTKVIINAKWYGREESGGNPRLFGYECWIEDGNLVGEVPEEMLATELKAGRVSLIGGPVAAPVAIVPRVDLALVAEIEEARYA